MRVSVWSHDANPAVDARLLKQSLSRCEEDVLTGWLRWLDPSDKSQGCIGTQRLTSRETGSREHKQTDGTMRAAWGMIQSGYAGPLVFQMRREAEAIQA